MNKLLLILLVSILSVSINAQTFYNVGPFNTPIVTNAVLLDFEISNNGTPYVFYTNSTTNKGTVKKWDGSNWVIVGGAADFTVAGITELDLEVDGNDVYVSYYKVVGTGSASDRIGIKASLNGGAWVNMSSYNYPGLGAGPIVADHGRPFDLEVLYGSIRLAFFDTYDEVLFKYCTWNSGTSSFDPIASLDLYDDDNDAVITALELHMDDDGTEWHVASFVGMGFETVLFERNGSSWQNRGDIYGGSSDASLQVGIESYWDTGGNYPELSIGGIKDDGAERLYEAEYLPGTSAYNFNNDLVETGNEVAEFDIAANTYNTYYFYGVGTSTKLRKFDGDGTVTATYTNFGTSGLKTNLKVDLHNASPVVAYITGGSLWVREEWRTTDFTWVSDPETCSGQIETFSNHITVTSDNLDNSDLNFVLTPDLLGVMPNASLSGTFPDYDLVLSTTYQATDVTVEINLEIFDEAGNLDTDNQFYPLVKANDSIEVNLPQTTVCLNGGPINLNNFLSPSGGQFSGNGLGANGIFHPLTAGPGVHTLTYAIFNATSGCTNSENFDIEVYDIPLVTVNSTNANCNDSTGTASVMTSSTALPHGIYWNTGADSATLADLPPGAYIVTITDNNGCITMGGTNVGNNSVNLGTSIGNVDCPGGNNGSVDLTIAGVSPFTTIWSNGYATEDITGLEAGFYDVVVTDANGCEANGSYEVTGPIDFSVSGSTVNASCSSTNGSATVVVAGGTSPYDYQWYDSGNNAIGTNSSTLSSVGGGAYYVVITDANGCEHTANGTVTENGAPTIVINQITNSSCANDGAIDITITSSAAIASTDWSNSATTEDITGLAPGNYFVNVVDINGCVGMGSADVLPVLPMQPDICLVTVDSITTTNLIVWEKPVTTSIDHYNVYREGSQAGLYQVIASVPYADESSYNDVIASPMVRSWRYRISVVDNCGNESSLSEYHKTIHATINVGLAGAFNILWDAYEGVTYNQWSCWRYTNAGGFEWLWTNSSNIFSYTDTPPTTVGLDYVVGFSIATCTSTKAQSYNGTRSNRSAGVFNASGLNVDEFSKKDFDVMLFPNPTDGRFSVHITGTASGNFDYQIMDVRGKIIIKGTQYLRKFDMNLSQLEAGIYYLNIINNGLMKTQKVIIK